MFTYNTLLKTTTAINTMIMMRSTSTVTNNKLKFVSLTTMTKSSMISNYTNLQHRLFSTKTKNDEKNNSVKMNDNNNNSRKLIYEGPMSSTLVRLKRVSALTFFLSLLSSPFMIMAPNASGLMAMAMIAGVVGGSGLSTGMIQYCGNPYVLRIYSTTSTMTDTQQSSQKHQLYYIFENTSFLGKVKETVVNINDLQLSDGRPFTTWKYMKNSSSSDNNNQDSTKTRYFYIHEGLLENNFDLQHIHHTATISGNLGKLIKESDNNIDKIVEEKGDRLTTTTFSSTTANATATTSESFDSMLQGLTQKQQNQ